MNAIRRYLPVGLIGALAASSWGAGAPREQPREQDSLVAVAADMDEAAASLSATTSLPAALEAQRSALEKLETAIAQLQRQRSQSMGGKATRAGASRPRPTASSKPGAGNPARTVAATGRGAEVAATLAATEDLVRDVWGHLPQRERDALVQPLREEFLPGYAAEIEAYFRALADPTRDANQEEQ